MFRLKEIRESKGLTLYRLEKLSGVRESTLRAIENGGNPTFKNMCKVADALEISLDDLRWK